MEESKLYKDFLFHNAIPRISELENTVEDQKRHIQHLEHSLQNSRSIIISNKLKKLIKKFKNPFTPQPQISTDNSISKTEYEIWQEKNNLSLEKLHNLKKNIENFKFHPKISIIMPVYNVEIKWLDLAIKSVQNQIYENWELCIVDDASTDKKIKPFLEKLPSNDERIKIKFRDKNGHISIASNDAISISSGEYITFLDNDDEISSNALYEVVNILNENKKIKFVFSDEDRLDKEGKRVQPIFKPDWSEELILSLMYTTHLSVFKRELVEKVGGFRKGFEGAQDYDLVLRISELLNQNEIYHIPKVLYHWRMLPTSTSFDYNAKPYAKKAALKTLQETIKRRKIKGKVIEGLTPSSFRIKREIIGNPKVSIIIPIRDKIYLLANCLESILKKSSYKNFEITIIDNGSNESESLEYLRNLKKYKNIKIIKDDSPFNYSYLNNLAAKSSNGEHLLFLNNDTEVINEDWIEALLEFSQQKEIGAVGARLWYANDMIQHAGVITSLDIPRHAFQGFNSLDSGYLDRIFHIQNYLAVTAACLMIKKSIFNEVGGFDEDLAIAFNDVDLCLKIHDKGYRNVYTPYSLLYHYGSISRGKDISQEKNARAEKELQLLRKRWKKYLTVDPFYNPNLTKYIENFSLNLD